MPGDGSQTPALWAAAAPPPQKGQGQRGWLKLCDKLDPLLINKSCVLCRALWLTGVAVPQDFPQTLSCSHLGTRDGVAADFRPKQGREPRQYPPAPPALSCATLC